MGKSSNKTTLKPKAAGKGSILGRWQLDSILGQGGNGTVWRASQSGGKSYALKQLHKNQDEARQRFHVEIQTLKNISHINGIVPLIDSYTPESGIEDFPWLVMPICESFDQYRKRTKFPEMVRNFIKLADTLCSLHESGYSHRDIKPANILFLEGRLCLSDFGLVAPPEKPGITPEKRDVGAKYTMAPEMRRYAVKADGKPADVYSFAKSLWIAITGIELGFDGQFVPDASLTLKHKIEGWYATPIEQLLSECTLHEPSHRPSMLAVRERLIEWVSVSENFKRRNELEWIELCGKLFPMGIPSHASWFGVDEICSVLNATAAAPGLNHMFYPNGGGMTLLGASRFSTAGLIQLHIGPHRVDILKPKKLSFESFRNELNWCYFRLEAERIEPIGIAGTMDMEKICEELVEIEPGKFAHPRCWDFNEYEGKPLPDSSRKVQRFMHGTFVIFSTTSAYNQDPDTYDARHNTMSEQAFRSYIERSLMHHMRN